MDKSKWEYKKWADVLNIINGRDYKEVAAVDGAFPICGSGGEIGRASEYLCPENTVIIGRKGNINKPLFIEEKFWNIDTAFGLVAKNAYLIPKFLFYFCQHYDFERHNKAVTIPSLTKGDLLKINMLLPEVSDQQRIVAELDCLNEMIAVKQEQLKEFDKLAQSIFYDMFGDPVSNEKGWDIIELGTKCEVTSFKRVLIEEVVDSGIPFIRGTELMALSKATKGEQIDFSLFITPEHYERVKTISGVPKVGDLLIPSINSDGNIWILDTDEPRYYKDGRVLWVHVNHDAFSSEALKYIMHILLKKTYSLMATGATFAELKLFVLRELKVPLPPLELQQQFADKISAIEAQKELVKQSIAETQSLFNSRMDYFFN